MDQTFNNTQIQQIKLAMQQVIDDQFGPDVIERLDRIERNSDASCKVGSDNREELLVTQSKVDDHEERIRSLESNFATT